MQEKILTAKVFVINKDGLILAIRRSKTDPRRPLTWDLPGGVVEHGEDPTETAGRELTEETGLRSKDTKIIATRTTNENRYIVRLIYVTHFDQDESHMTITLSYEHDQYKWVTKKEFVELDLPASYKDCLDNF